MKHRKIRSNTELQPTSSSYILYILGDKQSQCVEGNFNCNGRHLKPQTMIFTKN